MNWPASTPIAPYFAWEILPLYASVVLGLLAAWGSRRTLAALDVGWRGLFGAAALHLALTLLVPHAPIEPNNHGYDRYMAVRDVPFFDPPGGEPAHGVGWFVLLRPLDLLAAHQIEPMTWNALLSALSVVCFGAAVGAALGRRTGLVAALLLASLPVQIRTAPTVSMFVVSQLGMTATWLLLELHLRDRRAGALLAAVISTQVSMATHLELIALAPLSALAWIAGHEPGWFRAALRQPAWLAVLVFAVVLPIPHVLDVVSLPVGTELPDMGEAPMVQPVRAVLTRAALITMAAAFAARALPDARAWAARLAAWQLPIVLVAPPLWMSLVWRLGLPGPWEGHDRFDVSDAALTWVHPFFNPNHTLPWLVSLAAVGWLLLLVRRPAFLLPLTLLTGTMALAYGGRWDNWSTYVRGALPLAPLLLLPAAAALTEARAWVVALVVIGQVAPYADELRQRWTITEEFDLLRLAHEHTVAGDVVHTLTQDDVLPMAHPERLNLRYLRDYAPGMVRSFRDLAPGLKELLDLPDPTGRYVLLPLTCARGLWSGEPGGGGQVALGDRWYRLNTLSARDDNRDPGRQIHVPGLDACLATPCAGDRTCTCPDVEGAMTWDDPFCAAVRARLVLEPIAERMVKPDATGGRRTDLLNEAPTIGLYRVTGKR